MRKVGGKMMDEKKRRAAEVEVLNIVAQIKRLEKKAVVDPYAQEYYQKYFGDYGKELTKKITDTEDEHQKLPSAGWEANTGYREMSEPEEKTEKSSGIRIAAKMRKMLSRIKDSEVAKEIESIAKEVEGG
jgi:hypothetical protein